MKGFSEPRKRWVSFDRHRSGLRVHLRQLHFCPGVILLWFDLGDKLMTYIAAVSDKHLVK